MKKLSILTILLISQFSGAIFANEECIEGICINGEGTYIFENGDRYFGEFKDDKMHGEGTLIFGRDYYVGEFKDDYFHGRGTYTYFNGLQESGSWQYGEPIGQRTYSSISRREVRRRIAEVRQDIEDEARRRIAEDRQVREDDERRRVAEDRQVREDEERRRVAEEAAKENELIEISSGTGFFINDQGYFVSNNHVVEICSEVKTKKEGQIYTANIIAVDKINDLSLGKFNFLNNDYISMSDDGARLGEEIIVAGFPFQKQLSESIKITKGIISSLSGPGNDYGIFQMDAAVQPGNSGGPIINNQGNLIGVTVAKANSEAFYKETGSLPENINFGIKVEILESFLKGNNIRQLRSSSFSADLKTSIELAKKANDTTIHLQCWNTIASIRELVKDNKVRNLLININ